MARGEAESGFGKQADRDAPGVFAVFGIPPGDDGSGPIRPTGPFTNAYVALFEGTLAVLAVVGGKATRIAIFDPSAMAWAICEGITGGGTDERWKLVSFKAVQPVAPTKGGYRKC